MKRLLAPAAILLAAMTTLADEPGPKKEAAKSPPPATIDVAETAEKIVRDATEAGKRLAGKDAGDATQRLQQDALKHIDDLLRKAQEPPPKSDDSQSQKKDMGMGGGMTQPDMGGGVTKEKKGGGADSSSAPTLSRKERRERNRSQARGGQGSDLMPQPRPTEPKLGPGAMAGQPNRIEPKGVPPRIAEMYKDVWGQLPEKLRQEMDLYFREQFMPRYSDLLREYYSSLAERAGKSETVP